MDPNVSKVNILIFSKTNNHLHERIICRPLPMNFFTIERGKKQTFIHWRFKRTDNESIPPKIF